MDEFDNEQRDANSSDDVTGDSTRSHSVIYRFCDFPLLCLISPVCDLRFTPGKKECFHEVEYYYIPDDLISVNHHFKHLTLRQMCDVKK